MLWTPQKVDKETGQLYFISGLGFCQIKDGYFQCLKPVVVSIFIMVRRIVIILLKRQANKTGLGVVHISLTVILTLIFRPGQLKMIVIKYQ